MKFEDSGTTNEHLVNQEDTLSDLLCPAPVLIDHCIAILQHHGLPQGHAEIVAESLLHANLRGVDSHGITRLPIYVQRLELGLVEPNPEIRVQADRGASFAVDGGNGMGAVVAMQAMDIALGRLEKFGSVTVGIYHSNHYGSGAYYAEKAVSMDAAAFIYSNAPSTMAPWGGIDPYFGTNPYTFAVPAGKHAPLILDMATSVVARGKIILAANSGEPIPPDWAIDKEGCPTRDAQEALEGSVLPFGGAKGYGIAFMIDIMAGALTGAGFGPRIGDLYKNLQTPQNVGVFFHLIHVGAFLPADTFKRRIDTMIDEIQSIRPARNVSQVLVPGEIENRTAEARRKRGIPLSSKLVDTLEKLGQPAGLSLAKALENTAAKTLEE